MLTFNSCLCLKLETGGKILGWFLIIMSSILVLMSGLMLALTLIIPCDKQARIDLDAQILTTFGFDYELSDCQSITLENLLLSTILILLASGCFIIYLQLLRGISTRSHERILPALILEIISLISVIVEELISFNIKALLSALITGCISIYFCLILYSLYVKFKNEKKAANVKVMYSKPEGIPEDLLVI
ncbi:uncharacterized protein [Chironomus tepperi]|uniref:uncharacterized protein n=1 Tax=Chironomus tepperi TaxID=113505 RepID=UPI00391F41B7